MITDIDICSAYTCPILPLSIKSSLSTTASTKFNKKPHRKTGVAQTRRDSRKRRNRK